MATKQDAFDQYLRVVGMTRDEFEIYLKSTPKIKQLADGRIMIDEKILPIPSREVLEALEEQIDDK